MVPWLTCMCRVNCIHRQFQKYSAFWRKIQNVWICRFCWRVRISILDRKVKPLKFVLVCCRSIHTVWMPIAFWLNFCQRLSARKTSMSIVIASTSSILMLPLQPVQYFAPARCPMGRSALSAWIGMENRRSWILIWEPPHKLIWNAMKSLLRMQQNRRIG